jgi:hypothetical protein
MIPAHARKISIDTRRAVCSPAACRSICSIPAVWDNKTRGICQSPFQLPDSHAEVRHNLPSLGFLTCRFCSPLQFRSGDPRQLPGQRSVEPSQSRRVAKNSYPRSIRERCISITRISALIADQHTGNQDPPTKSANGPLPFGMGLLGSAGEWSFHQPAQKSAPFMIRFARYSCYLK